jgi:DNA-binding TFAR19-related protein (PDSD5 family)
MKIKKVFANNRKKTFELDVDGEHLIFPYAKLRLKPDTNNRVADVRVDPELGNEAFTYTLENGDEDSIHSDQVLEYNKDPNYMRDMLLYKLTIEAQKRLRTSSLSRREIVRRLGTSASQLYRLLDQTNYKKSIDQMLSLLTVLNCDVDLIVKQDKSGKQQSRRAVTSRARSQLVHA